MAAASLLNFASLPGARIHAVSSYASDTYSADNVLKEDESLIWISQRVDEHKPSAAAASPRAAAADDAPAPFWLVLQLSPHRKQPINTLGWYCWHSYTTNPQMDDSEYEVVEVFQADARAGVQLFPLQRPIAPETRFVRFDILDNFGASHVYMNRIYLFAEPFESVASRLGLSQPAEREQRAGGSAGFETPPPHESPERKPYPNTMRKLASRSLDPQLLRSWQATGAEDPRARRRISMSPASPGGARRERRDAGDSSMDSTLLGSLPSPAAPDRTPLHRGSDDTLWERGQASSAEMEDVARVARACALAVDSLEQRLSACETDMDQVGQELRRLDSAIPSVEDVSRRVWDELDPKIDKAIEAKLPGAIRDVIGSETQRWLEEHQDLLRRIVGDGAERDNAVRHVEDLVHSMEMRIEERLGEEIERARASGAADADAVHDVLSKRGAKVIREEIAQLAIQLEEVSEGVEEGRAARKQVEQELRRLKGRVDDMVESVAALEVQRAERTKRTKKKKVVEEEEEVEEEEVEDADDEEPTDINALSGEIHTLIKRLRHELRLEQSRARRLRRHDSPPQRQAPRPRRRRAARGKRRRVRVRGKLRMHPKPGQQRPVCTAKPHGDLVFELYAKSD